MGKFKNRHIIAALMCVMLALTLTGVQGPARAAGDTTMSAADFAAKCNVSPTFTLESNTVVSGGSGTLNTPYGTCWAMLAPGVSLTFDHVALDSQSSNMGLVVHGEANTQVHVRQSTIVLGGLYLEPGGREPGFSGGNNGLLEVSQSTLRATHPISELRLWASYCGNGGRVVVSQSDISASSIVLIAAGYTSEYHSCFGSNGSVQVTQSTVTSSNPTYGIIQVTTGQGGSTSASQNMFSSVSTSVWSDGACKSGYNIPETPCS